MQTKLNTPWGPADEVVSIAPGIMTVYTPSHGGILLDAAHVKRIPKEIGIPYSGTRSAWEEDCDWSVPYLLFEEEFANSDMVKRHGADDVRQAARLTLRNYRPDWLAAIDKALAKREVVS